MAQEVSRKTSRLVQVNPLVYSASCLYLLMKVPFLLHRVKRMSVERVYGMELVTVPEVLNPVVYRSGAYFASVIKDAPEASLPTKDVHPLALDMGTGSGIGALSAARRGYRVIGVDLNPIAVRCAQANVLLNGLESQVEIRHGDLFAPILEERFDLILFNPPFFRGKPLNNTELAWRGENVFERFAAGLPGHLKPGGRALILLSTVGEPEALLDALDAEGLILEVAARRHFGNEILTVYSVT
jgi:release factor glutamine methyltransferase